MHFLAIVIIFELIRCFQLGISVYRIESSTTLLKTMRLSD